METIKFLEIYVPILVHVLWILYALLVLLVFVHNTVLSLSQMGWIALFEKLNKIFLVPAVLLWTAYEMFWIKGEVNVFYIAGGIGLGMFFMFLLKYLATLNYFRLEKKL